MDHCSPASRRRLELDALAMVALSFAQEQSSQWHRALAALAASPGPPGPPGVRGGWMMTGCGGVLFFVTLVNQKMSCHSHRPLEFLWNLLESDLEVSAYTLWL